jgi:prepilin-type N-terminal cleavage/methylation domain-containing protein
MRKSRICKRSNGFTLIELLIVIAVLLVFGAVIFAGVTKIREKADAARSMGDLKQLTGLHHAFTVDIHALSKNFA